MTANGNKKLAQTLWKEWVPTVMNSFESLTDEELKNVFHYINIVAPPPR